MSRLDDEFEGGTNMISQCAYCTHKRSSGAFCAAFPDDDGIPIAILTNKADHREPYPGDNGVQFAPRAGTEDAIINYRIE